jgi:hypothetical protein
MINLTRRVNALIRHSANAMSHCVSQVRLCVISSRIKAKHVTWVALSQQIVPESKMNFVIWIGIVIPKMKRCRYMQNKTTRLNLTFGLNNLIKETHFVDTAIKEPSQNLTKHFNVDEEMMCLRSHKNFRVGLITIMCLENAWTKIEQEQVILTSLRFRNNDRGLWTFLGPHFNPG